jgi:hypothetical protein
MELRPSRQEWFWVLLLLGGLFLFNLATCNFYPAVWCDEILFSEPAINRVQYGSYTTLSYEFQPPGTFPIVNCPLYSLTLVPWLSVAGTSLLAVRSCNYTLMALAAFLCWNASWRLGLVRSASARLLLLLVLHSGYGMTFSYRCCRPDILGMVSLMLLLLTFKIGHRGLREFCLAGLAAVTVWIGLQVALFACFAPLVAWVMLRRPTLRELVFWALGVAVGGGSLFLFLISKGVLAYFLPPVLGHVQGHYYAHPHEAIISKLAKFAQQTVVGHLGDFSLVALIPLLVIFATAARQRLSLAMHRLVLYSLVLVFGVPALFRVVGAFAFYYSYLLFVPASLVLFAAYSELADAGAGGVSRWLKPVFAVSVVGAMLVGLPLRLGLMAATSKLVPRAEIRRVVASQISSQDVVFTDYPCFFEVKQVTRMVYYFYCSSVLCPTGVPGRDLSTEEKRAVSVLVIRPEQKDRLCAYFGGDWKAVSAPFGDSQNFSALTRLPMVGGRLARYATQPQTERFQLQVFRREPKSARIVPAEPTKAAN